MIGPTAPPRGELPHEVQQAAMRIHVAVWNTPYRHGRGPMHHAGGSYWRNELLRQADEWERMAVDARVCAAVLPEDDSPALSGTEPT